MTFQRVLLLLKLQMNFQFFYRNREICNRTRSVATQGSDDFSTRSVATQTSDEFSIFLQKSRDLQQKTFAFIHSPLEFVYRKSKGLNVTSSSLTIHCLITKFTEIIPKVFSSLFHSPFATPHISTTD
jgi:hypothetical protein